MFLDAQVCWQALGSDFGTKTCVLLTYSWAIWKWLLILNAKLYCCTCFLSLLAQSVLKVSHNTGRVMILFSCLPPFLPSSPSLFSMPTFLCFCRKPGKLSQGQLLCKCKLRLWIWCLALLNEEEIPSHWGPKLLPFVRVHNHYQSFNKKSLTSYMAFRFWSIESRMPFY